ncbi:MAG TPA: hypothetical protein VIZ28_00740 [Chitinophagaceae bacterium]
MTPAARSVFYFGLYLYLVGLTLVFLPNILLGVLQIPETNEVWIRVVGVLAFCIGYYYHRAGMANMLAFFKYTIPTRMLVFIAFTAFSLLGYVSPIIIGFGVIDLLGAIWTWTSLPKKKMIS